MSYFFIDITAQRNALWVCLNIGMPGHTPSQGWFSVLTNYADKSGAKCHNLRPAPKKIDIST